MLPAIAGHCSNSATSRDTGSMNRCLGLIVALVVLGTTAAACGSHHPSRLERAEYRAWAKDNRHGHHQNASCDRHGDAFTLDGRTYTAYVCTIHGGGAQEGARVTFAAYWNGHEPLSCLELPRPVQNALCFD